MDVVIVGAGKVGFSLAKYLVEEDHNVTIIEEDEERREIIQNNLDVMTISGNGASPKILMRPDVRNSDIIIAVTDSDEINMTVCMAAKAAGIKQTIARIRSSDYVGEEAAEFHKILGIDLIINPEYVTALEISKILLVPAALDVEDFASGRIRLLEVRIVPDSALANIPINELNFGPNVLIVGILRMGKMIIPYGRDKLMPYDNVFFIGDSNSLAEIGNNFKETLSPVKKVMIIGAGRIGRNLATILEQKGISVKVIEKKPERCQDLAKILKKGSVYCGEGTDIELLTEEGVGEADAVICLTDDDKLNLLLALLAKDLGAQKTIARVGRTEYIPLMEKVGVDVVLSPRLLTASVILSHIKKDKFVAVSLLEGAKAQAIEIIISPHSKVAGKKLKDAKLPRNFLVGAVVHDTHVYVPNGDSILYEGDRVVVFALPEIVSRIDKLF